MNNLGLEVSNQHGRLLSSMIIYYNCALLSRLLQKYEASGNARGMESLRRLSPVAWQHIFHGHYTSVSEGKELDLDAMIEGLVLSGSKSRSRNSYQVTRSEIAGEHRCSRFSAPDPCRAAACWSRFHDHP